MKPLAPSATRSPRLPTRPEWEGARIEKVDDGHYRANRTLFEELLSEVRDETVLQRTFAVKHVEGSLDSEVVIFPYLEADEPFPYSPSLLIELGLRPQDRIRTVNGFAVATPLAAIQAFVRLRPAGQLRVVYVRGAEQRDLYIELRR